MEEKKKINFEKLTTSELLSMNTDNITDVEMDDYFTELYNRVPFDGILQDINGLRSDVDELKRLLRSHKHTSDGKAVKDIDI